MIVKKILVAVVLIGLNVSFMPVIKAQEQEETEPFEYNGFIESRLGTRLNDDSNQKQTSIAEARLQLETEQDFDEITVNLVVDLVYDTVLDVYAPDLATGDGVVDFRQANIVFSPLDFMDIKAGRQILTWGTGDLLFINDLFAKDFRAFLIGRDIEYLKAPSDAIKLSMFFYAFNIDVVYTPTFGADRYIDGQRISFYDKSTNSLRGREDLLIVDRPNETFRDDEISLRLYRTFDIYETAFYFYDGYWKSPAGQNAVTGNVIFPKIKALGASLRGPVANGIGNIELGYYKSNPSAAADPQQRNSEYRYLVGYEQEIATELTLGLQFYVEQKLDYHDYISSLPTGTISDNQYRQVFTLRLTKLLMQQNLHVSFFNFYSPNDEDGYARMHVSYQFSDALKADTGLNIFYGNKPYTFYAQLEDTSNIYAAIRYSF